MRRHRDARSTRPRHVTRRQPATGALHIGAIAGSTSRLASAGLRRERLADRIEQARADDAAALPDARHLGEIDVPVVLRPTRRAMSAMPCA